MDAVTGTIGWLFNTRQGVLALLLGGIVLFLVIAVVLERRGKRTYYNHKVSEPDDGWGLFAGEDVVEAEERELAEKKAARKRERSKK